jgi:hemerythrin-like domain-containing protein
MMKITERLKAEHGILLLLLDHLEEILHCRAGREALQATVDAIGAAEEEHARVEHKLLFGVLADSLHPECPALTALQEDHRQVGHLAQQIRLGVFDEDMVRRYASRLRHHIERETHYFFPLVEAVVAEDALTKFGNWDEEHVLRTVRRESSAEVWLG